MPFYYINKGHLYIKTIMGTKLFSYNNSHIVRLFIGTINYIYFLSVVGSCSIESYVYYAKSQSIRLDC
jgi:hypothetical protein